MNIGNKVQLKSGGPIMTIKEFRDPNHVRCQWFDSDDKLQCNDFPLDSVVLVS